MDDTLASFRPGLRLRPDTQRLFQQSLPSSPLPAGGNAWFDAVRDFGAIGDGVADDTASIRGAIIAAGRRNTPLVIPPGRYRIVEQIFIPGNVTIIAYGACILNYTTAGESEAYLGVPLVVGDPVSHTRVEHVRIYGLEIDGRRASQTIGKAGLQVHGDVHHLLVKDCYFHDNTGDGWFTLRNTEDDNAIPTNCVFEDVVCLNNMRQGASITVGRHIVVRGGVYADTNGDPPSAGIDVEPDAPGTACEDILIEGVSLRNNAGAGLLCDYVGEGTTPVRDVRVSDCHIIDNGESGVTLRGGRGVAIRNCTVARNGFAGVELDMYEGSPLTDVRFVDCAISQNGYGGVFSAPFDNAATGYNWRFSNLTIVDNGTSESAQYHGMQFEGLIDDILVTGCTVSNRDTENQAYGLVTGPDVTGLRADLNNFRGNREGSVALADDESSRRYGQNNLD